MPLDVLPFYEEKINGSRSCADRDTPSGQQSSNLMLPIASDAELTGRPGYHANCSEPLTPDRKLLWFGHFIELATEYKKENNITEPNFILGTPDLPILIFDWLWALKMSAVIEKNTRKVLEEPCECGTTLGGPSCSCRGNAVNKRTKLDD